MTQYLSQEEITSFLQKLDAESIYFDDEDPIYIFSDYISEIYNDGLFNDNEDIKPEYVLIEENTDLDFYEHEYYDSDNNETSIELRKEFKSSATRI